MIAGHPLKFGGRGIHVLNFLRAFARNINQTITEMWDTVIPKLTIYLEGKLPTLVVLKLKKIYILFISKFFIENSEDEESWNQKSWEDLILKVMIYFILFYFILLL